MTNTAVPNEPELGGDVEVVDEALDVEFQKEVLDVDTSHGTPLVGESRVVRDA